MTNAPALVMAVAIAAIAGGLVLLFFDAEPAPDQRPSVVLHSREDREANGDDAAR